MKYAVEIESDLPKEELIAHLQDKGTVLQVEPRQYTYMTDLIFEGELYDALNVSAESEETAIDVALAKYRERRYSTRHDSEATLGWGDASYTPITRDMVRVVY